MPPRSHRGGRAIALIAAAATSARQGKLVQSARPTDWEAPQADEAGSRAGGSPAHASIRHDQEQLGEVAIAARGWARLNPEAFTREPCQWRLLGARLVCDPWRATAAW
jgi:hypothetical protein